MKAKHKETIRIKEALIKHMRVTLLGNYEIVITPDEWHKIFKTDKMLKKGYIK